jgi:hypothetical protein
MAIGDTVQAGLMRVDSSPILLAGQAQAKANQAFGDALGGAVEKFYQKKKDKQEREQRERAYRDAGLSAEEAKAASGDKELGSLLINKMNADRNFSLAQQEVLIEREKEKRAADLFDLKLEKTESDNLARDNFLKKLFTPVPTGKLNEAEQDNLQRGLQFLAPTTEAQENYKNELLQTPQFQETEPVFNMTGNRFIQQFAGESPAVQNLALNLMQSRQKDAPSIARVGNELNPETGEYEQIARDKFGNPIANYGPPKPSGMYPTPEDARRQEILVGRTKDAMEFNKKARDDSNIAISQAEQAQQALKYLPKTTGGLTSFVNEMKVIAESLGIDLPEGYQKDMADIGAFRQLTGQFLFQAMSNTKGAITDREMKLFRQIAPDIDNSRAANKLMLEIYVKAGERATRRRNLIRDLQRKDVDPRQIQIAIEDFDEANSFMDDIRSLPRKANSSNPQAQPNRKGVRGGNPPPDPNAQTPGGFKIQTR